MKKILVLVLGLMIGLNAFAIDWWNATTITNVTEDSCTVEVDPNWYYQFEDTFDIDLIMPAAAAFECATRLDNKNNRDGKDLMADIVELASHTMKSGKQYVGLKWARYSNEERYYGENPDVEVFVTYYNEERILMVAAGEIKVHKRDGE